MEVSLVLQIFEIISFQIIKTKYVLEFTNGQTVPQNNIHNISKTMIVKLKQWRFSNLSTSASSSLGLQPSHPLLSTVHTAPPQSAALQLLSSAPQAWNLSDSVALVGILVFISSD